MCSGVWAVDKVIDIPSSVMGLINAVCMGERIINGILPLIYPDPCHCPRIHVDQHKARGGKSTDPVQV